MRASSKDLMQVYPHGLVVTGAGVAPFILFKDKSKKQSFPIWMPYNPVKMQHNISDAKIFRTPSVMSKEIIEFFNYKIKNCIFDEIKSGVQWAYIEMAAKKDERQIETMKVLAYEAFSLGSLDSSIEYYATEDFVNKTREEEIEDKNLMEFNREKTLRKHSQKYLM